jgi:hypothetical protein
MSFADSLRHAKTPEAIRLLADKLRQITDTTSYTKGGKPSGYGGFKFDDATRQALSRVVSRLRRNPPTITTPATTVPMKTSLNLSKVDDIGRALGKITNSVATHSIKPTTWGQRLSKPGLGRGLAAGVGAAYLPRAIDLIYPNKFRTGFVEQ